MLSLGYQWCDVIHGWLYLKLVDKVALPFRGSSLINYIIMIIYYILGLRVRLSPLNSHDVRILKTFQYSVALSFCLEIFIRRVKRKQTKLKIKLCWINYSILDVVWREFVWSVVFFFFVGALCVTHQGLGLVRLNHVPTSFPYLCIP